MGRDRTELSSGDGDDACRMRSRSRSYFEHQEPRVTWFNKQNHLGDQIAVREVASPLSQLTILDRRGLRSYNLPAGFLRELGIGRLNAALVSPPHACIPISPPPSVPTSMKSRNDIFENLHRRKKHEFFRNIHKTRIFFSGKSPHKNEAYEAPTHPTGRNRRCFEDI